MPEELNAAQMCPRNHRCGSQGLAEALGHLAFHTLQSRAERLYCSSLIGAHHCCRQGRKLGRRNVDRKPRAGLSGPARRELDGA